MSEEKTQDSPKTPPPLLSLAQLNALCRKPMRVDLNFCGTPFSIECYRLTPAQDAARAEIVEVVTPPMIRGKTMEEDRPDFANPKFLKDKLKADQQARALGLYWCVPMFKTDNPDLTDPKSILDFIQGQLNETILATLWSAITNGGVRAAELVNFT